MSGNQYDIFDAINDPLPSAPLCAVATIEQPALEPAPTPTNADTHQRPMGAPNHEPINESAYAQRAIFKLMKGGEWYSSRQISMLAKVTHANGNIRTMKERGYLFEERSETNTHGVRYKEWRLIVEPDTESTDTPVDRGIQKLHTEGIQEMNTSNTTGNNTPII